MAEVTNIQSEMPKAYEPGKAEQKWYKFWLEKGYSAPSPKSLPLSFQDNDSSTTEMEN